MGILPLIREYDHLAGLSEPVRTVIVGAVTEYILSRYLLYAANADVLTNVQPYHKGGKEIAPILSYIHRNVTERITLDDLCSRFHLSKGKLNTLFHRQMGTTTMEYIIRRRLYYARQLLLNGIPASQACFASGFSDYTSFYRAFRKHLGLSPASELRGPARNPSQSFYLDGESEKSGGGEPGTDRPPSIWTVN